jgi:hypothetical protein
MSKYNQMMQYLNPKEIIKKTQIPHDNARASVTLQSSTVRNYAEFEETIIAYVAHHTQKVLGMPLPPDLCLSKARRFLDSSIGWDNAVYIAMSGAEGGVPQILNELNDSFKQESKQSYFTYFLHQVLDPMNFSETVELMTELKQKIGAYAPESFNYISAQQMAGNYEDIIWKYIDSVSRHRNLWDYSSE